MDKMKWKVKEVLEANDLNAFALVNKTHGKLSHNTVYALARGEPKRIALETLQEVIEALKDLTGKSVNVQDLLEYDPTQEQDDEADLLATSTAGLAEALDELERDLPPGEHEAWLQAFDKAAK